MRGGGAIFFQVSSLRPDLANEDLISVFLANQGLKQRS